jgi:signal transduction histidine kinase/FixJ family two-component response regulator
MGEITRVLLIDDDEDDYLITKDIFDEIRTRVYVLEWVSNYSDAISVISREIHDVYLVDYRLGAYNGLQVISEATKKGIKAPFILLTGQGDLEIDEKALKVGAVDFLVKGSFSPFELERSIRYSMEHNKNLKETHTLNLELEKRVKERTNELAATVKKLENANRSLQDQIRVRKIAEEALRESQNLYSTIAHNFPNGVISVFNQHMEYVFVDGTELTALGLDSKDLIGKKASILFEEQTGSYLEANLAQVYQGKSLSFEISYREKDYLMHATPLPGGTDHEPISQILVVSENITERKKAEIEIRKALKKEIELNELKSRFVTMASHEFRTPLSTIKSSASIIARYDQAAEQEKRIRHVERIKSNVDHLSRILNEFLSLGRLEEGKIENKPVYFDMVSLCESVVEELQMMAKPGQKLVFQVTGIAREVYLDQQVVKNVLINMLSNAIKYSPSGKDASLHLEFASDMLTMKITDQGIGIPEDEQSHVFDRFFRGRNTTNIQGTGLGLHIVKRYVDLLGGEITFNSKLNVGTTFTIRLSI